MELETETILLEDNIDYRSGEILFLEINKGLYIKVKTLGTETIKRENQKNVVLRLFKIIKD